MTDEEIKVIMALPKSAGLVPKYKAVWKHITGKPFEGCLCGDGFNRLYNLCKNYSRKLK